MCYRTFIQDPIVRCKNEAGQSSGDNQSLAFCRPQSLQLDLDSAITFVSTSCVRVRKCVRERRISGALPPIHPRAEFIRPELSQIYIIFLFLCNGPRDLTTHEVYDLSHVGNAVRRDAARLAVPDL